MKKIALLIIVLLVFIRVSDSQETTKIELTAQEILARVDDVFKYPHGQLKGGLTHIKPDGRSTNIRITAYVSKEDSVFTFSNSQRGDQLRVLYNLNGEDIWVYDFLSLKLFHKVDVDKFDPLFDTNYNFQDLSNADLQSNYTAKIIKTSTYKGKDVIILTLNPIFRGGKYGKLTLYVLRKNYLPMRLDFHDTDKVITKTLSYQLKSVNNRKFPVRYDMLHISDGTLTILQFSDYDEKQNFPAKFFRHENLSKLK